MKIREIVLDWVIETDLFEMAFERKTIINRLRSFQPQINRHALKIIAWPDAQEVPHWKRELTVWGNDLAGMTLRTGRGLRPVGFNLPWKHLYLEPFEGVEQRTVEFLLRAMQREGYDRPITKPTQQIVAEYTAFVGPFCQVIGSQQEVSGIVNSLGAPGPHPVTEAAAE